MAEGRLEVVDLPGASDLPAVVLLHEGLGSVELWRGLPDDLHRVTGLRTIVFSRFGHGRSDPPPRPRTPSFMDDEALEVLPAVMAKLGVDSPIVVGHSDGGSIALIFSSVHPVAGLVLIAPHVFVEELSIESIERARDSFETKLRERMGRYHNDPVVTFSGWCDVWLDPAFRSWSLESRLADVAAPALLIQGRGDPYGTLTQIESIQKQLNGPVELLVVDGGHSPHLEHRDAVLTAVTAFIRRIAQ